MRTEYNVVCSTKNHKDATAVESAVRFVWPVDWNEAKRLEVLEQLAIDSLTIKWQSSFRNADKEGNYKTIPVTATVTITEPGRKAADPDKVYRELVVKTLAKAGKVIKPEDVTPEQIEKAKAVIASMEF